MHLLIMQLNFQHQYQIWIVATHLKVYWASNSKLSSRPVISPLYMTRQDSFSEPFGNLKSRYVADTNFVVTCIIYTIMRITFKIINEGKKIPQCSNDQCMKLYFFVFLNTILNYWTTFKLATDAWAFFFLCVQQKNNNLYRLEINFHFGCL